MMPSAKIKEILLAACLYATLIAQPAWALTIHVAPTANPQTTLADIKALGFECHKDRALTQILATSYSAFRFVFLLE